MRTPVHDLGGSGSPLVIVHATGFTGRSYAALAALLRPYHHVHALDLRGHGDHALEPGESLDLRDVADDVIQVLDDFPSRPHVFAHSVGGVVSLFAESSRGGLARSLFVYEPGLHPADAAMTEHLPVADGARRRRQRFTSRGEAMFRYASRPPLDELSSASLAAYVESGFVEDDDGSVRLACVPDTEAAYFDHAPDIHLDDVLHVAVPVTIASGPPERSPLAEHNERLAKALPRGRYRRFPHLGHLGPLEHPPSVAAAVLDHTSGG